MSRNSKIFYSVAISLALLLLGVVLTVRKAEAAAPGDLLYSVDRTYEGIQRKLRTSDVAKADFEIVTLGERMDELEAIDETGTDEQVQKALDDLDKQRVRAEECVRKLEENENRDEGELERIRNRYEQQVREQYENMEQVQENLQNNGEESQIKTANQVRENYKKEIESFDQGSQNQENKPEDAGDGNGSTDEDRGQGGQ